MKRNAILRIILWTVTLVVLVGLLCAAMLWFLPFGRYGLRNRSASEVTHIPEKTVSNGTATEFPRDIREIEIDWLSGNIRILPADVENISVLETTVEDSRYAMVCKQEGQTLKIEYCQNTIFGDLKNLKFSKDLTITVPKDWDGRALKVDAASSKLYVEDLNIRDVEVDTASGTSQFHNCTVDELDIDTASGDIRFTGSLNRLECDSASASVYAELDNVPSEIDMDTASGAVELILPKDAGFSVKLDSMSGSFDSDFPTTMKNGQYVCGDGACRIDMSSMSGKVTIRAGS
ncbi:MAG: DUF4097 family beta strand repeat-containing protein [Faecousia sp.]